MAKKKKQTLALNTKYLFVNDNNNFIASIQQFEPLRVTIHLVRNGCQIERELSIDSLNEYTISEMTQKEVNDRLTVSDV